MSLIHRNKNPYKSTNIYRVTASLYSDFPTLTPFEKVERARQIVFNFDYPTPDNIDSEEFKKYFETMFITRFWERFFASETFEAYQMRLYSKMLEVMPIYAEMLGTFFMQDKDRLLLAHSKTDSTHKENSSDTREGSVTGKNSGKAIASVFPANMMTAGSSVNSVNYANNGNVDEASSSQTSKDTNKGTRDGENHSETVSGVLLDSLIKFNAEFKTIFTSLINEFNSLYTAIIDL